MLSPLATNRQVEAANWLSDNFPLMYRAASAPTTNYAIRSALYGMIASRLLDSGSRDIDTEAGYLPIISVAAYGQMYDREGLGQRVVHLWSDECWLATPTFRETERDKETTWETNWKAWDRKTRFVRSLYTLDQISGVGHFGAMFLGLSDKLSPDQPVKGWERGEPESPGRELQLLFTRCFDERSVTIDKFDTDPMSPRFGMPSYYRFNLNTTNPLADAVEPNKPNHVTVHWSRVIHYADNCRSSPIYGVPRQRPVFNYLLNVRKIAAGSPEMMWKGGCPGLSFELMPELLTSGQSVQIDKEALREEMQRFSDGLQRYVAVEGVTTKTLPVQVADPGPHIDQQLRLISITMDVPKRLLEGSERGELSSEQDGDNWKMRVQRQREMYRVPDLVEPAIERLMLLGVVPQLEDLIIGWGTEKSLTPEKRADIAEKLTRAMGAYVAQDVSLLVPPEIWLREVCGIEEEVVDAISDEQDNWLMLEEAHDAAANTPEGTASDGGGAPPASGPQGGDGGDNSDPQDGNADRKRPPARTAAATS